MGSQALVGRIIRRLGSRIIERLGPFQIRGLQSKSGGSIVQFTGMFIRACGS